MADENIVTNIVANADFSNLIADVNRVSASLSKLQAQIIASDAKLANQVAVMNRSFAENLRRTGQFSTHFVTLTSDVEKFGKNLDTGKLKLRDYFRTFQDHTRTSGGLIRDLAKQQVALQNAIIQPLGKNAQGMMQYNVHIPQGLDAIKNKTSLARQELQIMNKVIQDGGVQLINWGKNTQWAGRQLTVGLTVPLVALGAAAAKSFREADAELTRLTKVYGGVAATSSADLAKIRNEVSSTARELAKAYGTSFKETIQLAADVAATGKTGNDLINSVKETTRLAVLGEVDRQDAMKATLAIQTAFKQNTEQLSESINFLNSVENQTSTSLADLIEAIPKAGPVVQGLGGSVKDLALYMTAMKEGGINASEGANALKSALASLINPTKVAQEQFAGMGISLKNIVNDNAGDLTGMILELQTALDTLNPLQKQQAIEQLFGKFQFARMNALFENLGKQGSQTLQVMDLMKASSQDLANVASRELSLVTESASGKYKRAVESLKASLAGIGEEFLKVQTFFINVTDSVVKFVNNLPGPVKTILTFVTGLTAVMGPIIMLTGVLANFFGYIIKGASHFRALFKGGEGWKMLTPEILAAQKAGSLVEATFYSDAKAATVLKNAIDGLIAEFTILEQKAKSGAISVAPAFTTMAGNLVAGGGRQVNPNHPLLSPTDTRSMSHMNPVAGMTAEQKAAQTIFGVVPGAPKVNQKISNNPQMYMSGDMPQVEGLTSIKGTSTGVVAAEAAKWHAMTGALAMQSEAEIKALKTEVSRTGLITRELSDSYEALLPTMTDLTANAAKQSAAIVAELQAGTIQVDQARAKIMALNAQVERMIADAAVDIAGQQGRSINLTSVPLLNQPVVDASGKSNMKELSRPGRTRGLLNRIAGGLGVKTFGAPYSIETTMPKRMATGGPVYLAGGGPSGTDTVPAWLTEGEYVLKKSAVEKLGVPLLDKLNEIGKTSLPDLGIGPSSKVQASHVSEGMAYAAHELPGMFGPHLPKGTEAFAKALPDHKVQVYNEETLGLWDKENQALRAGKRGLTRSEMLRALAAPNSRLFGTKHFKGLDPATQKTLKKLLLQNAKLLPEGKVFHDDAVARIWEQTVKDAHRGGMPKDQLDSFKTSLKSARTSAMFRADSFESAAKAQGNIEKMTASEAKAKSGADPFYYKSPDSPTGKEGKYTVVVTDPVTGQKQSITTGGTKKFKKSIQSDPRLAGKWEKPAQIVNPGGFFHKFRRVPELFQSAMLNKKWSRRNGFANGGYVGNGGPRGYANGGMVVDGYADGGPVKGYAAGGLVAGLLAAMGIPMLGNMLGNKVGGTTGAAIGNVSNILPFLLPMGAMSGMTKGLTSRLPQGATSTVKPLAQTSANLTAMGKAGSSAGAVMSKLGPIFGRVLASVTPLGLAITGVTTALTVGFTIYKKHQEYLKLNALGYGLTAEAAQKAGLKYVDYNQKIKDSIQRSKDMMEANKLAYESMTQAGIPIKMTITEYKKLKDEVKGAYSEQIKLINSTDKAELGDVAVRLKTQLMAAGQSAEESTKKIYAMMSLSKNAGMAAASTVGNKDFNAITDAKTAAGGSLKSFDTAVRLGEAQAQAAALNTSLTAIDAGVDEIVRKSEEAARKDKTNKTEAISKIQAEVKMMEYLNASQFRQTKLTKDTINEMAKANPAIKELASTSDTVVSVWQKLRLQAMGLAGDLSKLNAEQTAALYNIGNIISEKVIASNKGKGGLLEQEYKDLGTLQKQRDDLAKKAAGQSVQAQIDSKKRLKELQDQIDKTNKLADARIKALNAAKEDADLNREMESAKLELQFAESTGNTQQAAQARLRYEGAVNNLQNLGQTRAIQAAADKANAGPLAEIAKIQSANEKLADAAALAGTGLAALDKKIAGLIGTIDGLNNAQSAYQLNLAKWKTENPGMTETDFLKTELGKYLSAGLVAPTKAAGANLPAANGAYPGKGGWVPATTPGASAAAMSSKAFTTDTFIVGDKNLATVLDKAFNGGGQLPGTPTTIPKTPAAGQYGGGTYVSLSQLQKSGAQKKFAGPSDRTGTYVGSTFTDEKGQKWKVTADAGYAGFAVTKAGKGLMDVDPNKPIIVGDMGPELLYNNMVIPNLSSIPFASPSFNIPAGAKALTGLMPGSSSSESTIVYQTFNQAPGEDADAFIRKVTQATVQAIGKDAKLIKSQSGESRSI
jgi:TP901 family phage tail tape measure protein